MSPIRLGLILIIGVVAGSFGTKNMLDDRLTKDPALNAERQRVALDSQRHLLTSCMQNGVYFIHDPRTKTGVIISCEFVKSKAIGPENYDAVISELRQLYEESLGRPGTAKPNTKELL